ncbi:hypothetical protein MCOR25_005122 [Pyricularia grisea]|uniref:Uncharacterized protein n=1 Tax=Pyricularia grisea TaxID=148305 RepID=A0A6P8BBM6_PYRGI|nr:uncharacterized protein PgNI_05104 [Pyricularia grisea]KAI6366475.1 hypothetical protein MCOR25_005122 [Pyricularia grisea]TLD13097.1 hypothetical protein PgNI_05104 [Pyricularia grisea]
MDMSELTCIISKFDPLSDYSDSETEIFKHPVPSRLQTLLRPCLKQPQQQTLSSSATTGDNADVAALCCKTARFAAAHLLAKCLVTGKVVPTREEERAARIDEDGLDMGTGDRRRQQRRQKRAKLRQKQDGGGGNLLDDDLAFHKGVGHKKGSPKLNLSSGTTSTTCEGSVSKEAASARDRAMDEPITNLERESFGPEYENLPTDEEKILIEEDPEELALDETLVEAFRNAAINQGDVAPLQSLDRFAWQSRWTLPAAADNLDLNS